MSQINLQFSWYYSFDDKKEATQVRLPDYPSNNLGPNVVQPLLVLSPVRLPDNWNNLGTNVIQPEKSGSLRDYLTTGVTLGLKCSRPAVHSPGEIT
jgi:hypothetical protein